MIANIGKNGNGSGVSMQAIATEQDGVRLFVGVARAGDLTRVTTVDYYKPALPPTDERQGYQRPAERSRITKIGKYLMEQEESLFPTAVLLASRSPLKYDRREGTVSVSPDEPLQIVDGQHRLAGIRYAVEEKGAKHLADHNIPFVIMDAPDRLTEMTQFRIVNGTAKSVRTDLVNMILTATYAGTKRHDVPKKDQWRIVTSNVVDRLAKDAESPWRDMIALPGETGSRGEQSKLVRATSFITSLRPVYIWLKEMGIFEPSCRSLDDEIEFLLKIVAEYWRAIQAVVPEAFEDPNEYVIQKTPGLFSLHLLLRHLLGDMYRGRRKFDEATFVEYLGTSPELVDADFWRSDSRRASVYGSMKGFSELYEILAGAYV